MAAMMALGLFTFSLSDLAFQELQRRTSWRHGQTPRFGTLPANQFMGRDGMNLTVSGLIYPGMVGRMSSLAELREMGDTGSAWPLVTGYGEVWGAFVLDSVEDGQQIFMDDGRPRKADFTVQMHQVDDDDARDKLLPAVFLKTPRPGR